jgi:two-component system sensor histidine kinase VanS
MHELRRPLQALALLDTADGGPGDEPRSARRGLLELARSALAELDGEVNGRSSVAPPREVSFRELLHAALERWREPAEASGGVKLYWDAGVATVVCDPVRVSQALDNLLANAVEHGAPPIVVTGTRVAGRLRITIANGVRAKGSGSANGNGEGAVSDPRRGHGIEVVSAVAAEHRGRFALAHTGSGCVVALELPLAEAGLLAAA